MRLARSRCMFFVSHFFVYTGISHYQSAVLWYFWHSWYTFHLTVSLSEQLLGSGVGDCLLTTEYND